MYKLNFYQTYILQWPQHTVKFYAHGSFTAPVYKTGSDLVHLTVINVLFFDLLVLLSVRIFDVPL